MNNKEFNESGLIKAFKVLQLIPKPDTIKDRVKQIIKNNPNDDIDDLCNKICKAAIWKITGVGVVASLPGAIPGIGTAIQIGVDASTMSGETWYMLRNLTTMSFIVAGLKGHDLYSDERLDELLLIWGFSTGLVIPAKEAAKRIVTKIAVKQFNNKVSGKIFAKINQRVGTTVLTKWGAKRGGIAVGRLIPFGVGAAIGGGMNFTMAQSFSKSVLLFYTDILPNNGEVYINE